MGKALRVSVSALLAAAVTFSLFLVMVQLILVDGEAPVLDQASHSFSFNRAHVVPENDPEDPEPEPKPPELEPLAALPKLVALQPNPLESEPINIAIPSIGPDMSAPEGVLLGTLDRAGSGPGSKASADIVPLTMFQPPYPPEAAMNQVEGYVVVAFTVNRFGNVSNVEIIQSEPARLFDSVTRKAVSRWTFKPHTVDGVAFDRRVTQRIDFTLDE